MSEKSGVHYRLSNFAESGQQMYSSVIFFIWFQTGTLIESSYVTKLENIWEMSNLEKIVI